MSELPKANVRPVSNLSVIWILPFLALAVGAWLAWQAYSQRGVEIEIVFDSGAGIEVGKTPVVYKGMAVGMVRNLRLDMDGEQQVVIVTVEMKKEFSDHLRDHTRFWLVRPSITLAGISGLETLVSGNFIGVSVGGGERSRRFYALSEEPPLPDDRLGLHLTLEADKLGSLSRGSPVFYRQIEVGQIKAYHLSADQQRVEVEVFIEPEYTSLISPRTRFWNASGVTVDAGFSGVKFRTESLSSIVAGGIAFTTPDPLPGEQEQPLDASHVFRLYEDFESAQAGVVARVVFEDYEGLQAETTPVIYKGMRVGEILQLQIEPGLQQAEAILSIDPMMEPHLVEGAQFWVVKPSVSLAGVSGLEALVKGNYIAMRPGSLGKKPRRDFVALLSPPPPEYGMAGRTLTLTAESLGSIEVGSPLLYKQVKVGAVQSFQLSQEQVQIRVHIDQAHAHLINTSTRFWNASGFAFSGSPMGVELHSESVQALLAGGIAFETPQPRAPTGGSTFQLHPDRQAALRKGSKIKLRLVRGDGLKPGTPIRYRGLEVGYVDTVKLSPDLQSVELSAWITRAEKQILRANSRFRVVRPELGLLRTNHLETLVTGPYLEVEPGSVLKPRQTRFKVQDGLASARKKEEHDGLELTLSTTRLGSIRPGNRVTYRGVVVGKVDSFALGPHADRVLVRLRIESRYAPLVYTGSKFWETSGVAMDFDLLEGAKVRAESLRSVMEGGIAFATPEGSRGNRALPGQTFLLYREPREEWLDWAPRIALESP